jgi:Zn-dependent alcohol dehydrogenase
MGGALEKNMENQVFVGIDVSKARLDMALRPGAESFSVTNNQRGLATLVKRLKNLGVSRIVLEASGGYEIAAAAELAARVGRSQWSIPVRYGILLAPRADRPRPPQSTLASGRIAVN